MSWGIVAYKRDAYKKSGFYVDFLSLFNLFRATGLFPYPLKTSGNQRFSDVFRGYRKRLVAWNVLTLNRYLFTGQFLGLLAQLWVWFCHTSVVMRFCSSVELFIFCRESIQYPEQNETLGSISYEDHYLD